MLSKIVLITLLVVSVTSFSIVTNSVDAKKSCEEKKWSDCKGDKGWYTHHGNHHCFKGEKDCYLKNGHHSSHHSY